MEEVEFREAVYEDMINVYDDICADVIKDTLNESLNGYQFNAYAAMVFGVFLGEVYGRDHKKFLELVKPVYEEYLKYKSEEDAKHRRTLMRISNIEVVK